MDGGALHFNQKIVACRKVVAGKDGLAFLFSTPEMHFWQALCDIR
jgi:hypothetical protein